MMSLNTPLKSVFFSSTLQLKKVNYSQSTDLTFNYAINLLAHEGTER